MEKLFELVTHDHEALTDILDELTRETDEEQAEELLDRLLEGLESHMEREEEHLYSILEESAFRDLASESYDEHDRMRQITEDLTEAALLSGRWKGILRELREAVVQHFTQEEGTVFERVRELTAPGQLEKIAASFAEAV